jgi:type 2 lantibiotic biosynthesis protein LanM
VIRLQDDPLVLQALRPVTRMLRSNPIPLPVMLQGSPVDSLGLRGEQDLAWRAATLAERVASVGSIPSGGDRVVADDRAWGDRALAAALAPWARAFAFGDLSALLRRLAWDGVDASVAARALSDHAGGAVDAPWVEWLPRFLACRSARPGADPMPGPSPEPPFIEAWAPLLLAARTTLASRRASAAEWFSPDALRALERHLVRQFAAVGELVLFEAFTAGVGPPAEPTQSRYGTFVGWLLAGGWANVFQEYPVLARQLAQLAQDWVDGVVGLISHLDVDGNSIEEAFGAPAGRVDEIEPGLSDRHGGGLAVSRVVLSSGLCLAYKPRDVSLEAAFHRLVTWLAHAGLDAAPPAARVVDRGDHGWVQWVEQADFGSAEKVTDYFRRAGSLACLVHFLGAADLHHENLVASALGPVLIDGEMLLQPLVGTQAAHGSDGERGAAGQAGSTCLSPGLVSLAQIDGAGRASDIGGLQPATTRTSAVGQRRWQHLRSDDVAFTLDRSVVPTPRNDVRRQGVLERPAAHADALCAGFEQTYRFLSRKRSALLAADGPVSWFAACSTRVLFRPSDQYGALQYILAAPRYQRRGADRSLAIETLARVFCRDVARPRLWPLLGDERLSLERLEIPRQAVAACGTTLLARAGAPVDGYISRSGCDAVRLRLLAIGDGDLDYQLDELRAGLSVHDALPAHEAPPSLVQVPEGEGGARPPAASPGLLLTAAEAVAEAVLARARQGSGGALTWPACQHRLDLYSGSSGLLLFLSALAAATGSPRWRVAARGAFEGIRTASTSGIVSPPHLGGCSGRPSMVYALTLAGHLLDDRAVVDTALALARGIPAQAIDEDPVLDVEGGCAGTLLALLAAVEQTGSQDLLDLCARCVARLLATQVRGGRDDGAWPAGRDARPRLGFAHGAAGIAYALARSLVHGPNPGVVEAVRLAWGYERRVFVDHNGTWPVIRADGSRLVMAAWCHGAPGIALARACSRRYVSDAGLLAEIAAASRATMEAPRGHRDHLCCGNLGRADVLLTVGRALEDAALVAEAGELAASVARQISSDGRPGMRGQGFEHGATTPGFFQGLSGIGYQLVRASWPDRVPSVLAFQWPTRRVP